MGLIDGDGHIRAVLLADEGLQRAAVQGEVSFLGEQGRRRVGGTEVYSSPPLVKSLSR